MNPIRSKQGFTLAELLVAATLMSLVMASVYTLFYSTIRTWRHGEGGFDNHLNARTALSVLGHELENLVDEAGYLMEGENDSITMIVVSEPFYVEKTEGRHMMQVEYSFNRTGHRLERKEALIVKALPNIPPGDVPVDRTKIDIKRPKREFTLAENVRDFELRYIWVPAPERRPLEEPPPPVTPLVVDQHKTKWGLPQAIEARLTVFDPEDKDREYVFVLKRRLNAPNFLLSRVHLEKRLKNLL